MAATHSPLTLSTTFTLLSLLLLSHLFSLSTSTPSPEFEGFDSDDLDELTELTELGPDPPIQLSHLPPSPPLSPPSDPHQPPPSPPSDYWDEDEFEGLPISTDPVPLPPSEPEPETETLNRDSSTSSPKVLEMGTKFKPSDYIVEFVCVTFLIMFAINYFTGKKENENLALAWAAKFAAKDSIFDKNFSLVGVGEGDDSPLLLKEGQTVFKFYASGRRYCQGLLATMELKSRHDLISRVYNMVVPCKDEISFEVYMNDEAMDHVVFAVAKRKLGKLMVKEVYDLQKFGSLMSVPSNRKWVSDELTVISESKEVACDLISDVVLDQVFGEKAFEKLGKYFISMHFSDQQSGIHKKKLLFKFALPDTNHMADMTRLVALVPYYIDLVGRYRLSSQARAKTDTARVKAAQEVFKEMQQARQEVMQKKKTERKKMMEEAEAKLSAEAIRKRDAKERARQMKKGMPKIKMSRS